MLNITNHTYYFTYATSHSFPFLGGWTEIEAPSKDAAIQLFNHLHPNKKHPDTVNCSFIYDEEEWKTTAMYKTNSNCGYGCHEHFVVTITETKIPV